MFFKEAICYTPEMSTEYVTVDSSLRRVAIEVIHVEAYTLLEQHNAAAFAWDGRF